MHPNEVPNKLASKINYKIFLLIFGLLIAFQFYITNSTEEDADSAITIVSIVNPLVASIAAFFVAKKYAGTAVFGKAYFALGLGLMMFVLGEFSYLYYDLVLGIDPYPSIADVFFFSFYPLAMFHLVKNIRFFKPKLDSLSKILIVIIPIVIVVIYSVLSYIEIGEMNFDYYYGLIFIMASATVLSGGLLGARIFRQGVLGMAWLVLVIGILLTTIGDVWYYYLETFGQYELTHPVNLFWWASYMVITYALYKHQDII